MSEALHPSQAWIRRWDRFPSDADVRRAAVAVCRERDHESVPCQACVVLAEVALEAVLVSDGGSET